MSRGKIDKPIIFSFSDVWPRILATTDIKKYKELANLVNITPSRISERAKEDNFPVDWAYWVAKKYDLNIDWLLTGEGEKEAEKKDFLLEVQEWLDESCRTNADMKIWFKVQFEIKFPEFVEWKKRKDERLEQHNIPKKIDIA